MLSKNGKDLMDKNEHIPDGQDVWFQHRVSYGETDMMGVVYYAEYFHIFERARNEIIRSAGYSYKDVEKRDVFLPVCEAHCRYRKPARYDELLQLHVWVSDWRHASFVFQYRIYDESRTVLLSDGYTKHAFVNSQGRPIPVPDWFKEILTRRDS